MNILLVFGTRPEFIKLKPIIDELKSRNFAYKVFFTGQHTDLIGNDLLESDFLKPNQEDIQLTLKGNRLVMMLYLTMNYVSRFIEEHKFDYVMVQGDTTSALGGALAAFYSQVKTIHIEAGLRTNDIYRPYPEESNRQFISKISDINFCPTKLNASNLIHERINGENYVVGNTGLDPLISLKSKVVLGNKVLVTLHRRENHDKIEEYFNKIAVLSNQFPELEFILPIHPNPNVIKHKNIFDGSRVKVLDSLPHKELLDILVECKFVITDSGGLQEECNFLNKMCIVCRPSTERPEAVGQTSIMCARPFYLEKLVRIVNEQPIPQTNTYPFGDGTASKKIVDILERYGIVHEENC